MKVTSEISIVEVNGEETTFPRPTLIVESHHQPQYFVTLRFEGQTITVNTAELRVAISNAVR